MKAKELAEQLMRNPDFDVNFLYSEDYDDGFFDVFSFNNLRIIDVSDSDKMILLGGDEIK